MNTLSLGRLAMSGRWGVFILAAAFAMASMGQADQGQRIIGGTPSAENPAVGALLSSAQEFYCTGFLIGPSCVLTAAHCVEGGILAGGSFFIGPDIALPWEEWIGIRATRVHPGYDPDFLANDFAVVALLAQSTVAPIAMSAPPSVGTMVRIIGYGLTEGATDGQKRIASVPVASVNSTHIEIDGTPTTCFGDSGGPLLKAVGPGWEAVGVTSAGDLNCEVFATFGRIDSVLATFITPTMAEICTATTVGNALMFDGFESGWADHWSEVITSGNSCTGFCGGGLPGDICFCDDQCLSVGNCCPDVCQACGIGCPTAAPEDELFGPSASVMR